MRHKKTRKKISQCMFCGGETKLGFATLHDHRSPFKGIGVFYVECKKCLARGPSIEDLHDENADMKAINIWNEVAGSRLIPVRAGII